MNRNSYERLTAKQKSFIEKRVKELGSMDRVIQHYSKEYTDKLDLVERWARKIGKEVYSNED